MTSEFELERCRRFVATAGWRNDSSIPGIPYEYTVRGKAKDGLEPPPIESHDWFVAQIRQHGERTQFDPWSYVYLELDGWRYWAVGNVISRERRTASVG